MPARSILRNMVSVRGTLDRRSSRRETRRGNIVDRVNYVDIHNGLEETDAWLRTMGLEQNDRLRQSKRSLAMMAEAAAKGTLGASRVTRGRGPHARPRGRAGYSSGVEREERAYTVQACFFKKRPLWLLPGCQSAAKARLGWSCNPRDCGVIAISISRICNDGDKILVLPSEDVLRQILINEIDSVRRDMAAAHRDVTDPKIAWVLYHLSTPAFREDIKLYVAAYSVTIDPIPGKSDAALLKALSELI